MKSKNIVLIISSVFYFYFLNHLYAQDLVTEKNMLSASVLGTSSYLGFTYERLITDHFVAELGIGVLSLGFGATFYPSKIKENKMNFYTGLKYGSRNALSKFFLRNVLRIQLEIIEKKEPVLYVPFGINYPYNDDMNLALDIGPSLNGSTSIYANLRLGFRF